MKKHFLIIALLAVWMTGAYLDFTEQGKQNIPFTRNVIKDAPFNIEMVEIPAGILNVEADYTTQAMDIHIESFYIGKYEVTQKLWKDVMGTYPAPFEFDDFPHINAMEEEKSLSRMKEIAEHTGFIGDDLPVETVSWNDIQGFLKKLSEKTGHVYRLPTEAEWLYAYKAGTETNYAFGNDTLLLAEYEWYNENSGGRTHPVGQKKPNPWGLYDMGGNVAEWTSTIADMHPYRVKYPDRKWSYILRRKYRGSHYRHTKFAAATYWAHSYSQFHPHHCVGFRLVRKKKNMKKEDN